MISSNSRYANSLLVTVKNDQQQDVHVITPSPAVAYTFTYTYHIVSGSERIDNIAYAFYKDPSKWWTIADANPEIMDWSSLATGTIIRIPNA